MSGSGQWRVPWRVARRELRRRPGRTALVATLVAIPVAAMTVTSLMIGTTPPGDSRRLLLEASGADAVILPWPGRVDGQAQALERAGLDLPADATTEIVPIFEARIAANGSVPALATIYETRPSSDPRRQALHGRLPTEGRMPAGGETLATPRLLRDLDIDLGNTVTVLPRFDGPGTGTAPGAGSDDGAGTRLQVVGLVENPYCLSCAELLVPPNTKLGPTRATSAALLVHFHGDPPEAAVAALNARGAELAPKLRRELRAPGAGTAGGALEDRRSAAENLTLLLGGVALITAGIVIAAAFAVGARRQLTTLGHLSCAGAPPALTRRYLVLQGAVAGALGSATGLALGAATMWLGRGYFERALDHRVGSWEVGVTQLMIIGTMGIVTATLAATVPARAAARIPTLMALAGRRPLAAVTPALFGAGIGAIAVGLGIVYLAIQGTSSGRSEGAWTVAAVAGGVAQLLGACAIAPALVARLGRLAEQLRGPGRLAARSLARQRTRTAATTAAVAAVGGLAIFGGGMALGLVSRGDSTSWSALPPNVAVLTGYHQTVLGEEDGERLLSECPRSACSIGVGPDGVVTYRPGPLEGAIVAEASRILGGAEVIKLATAPLAGESAWSGGPQQGPPGLAPPPVPRQMIDIAVVVGPDAVDALDAPEALRGTLDEEGIVVAVPEVLAYLAPPGSGIERPTFTVRLPTGEELEVAALGANDIGALTAIELLARPAALVTPEAADRWDLEMADQPTSVVLVASDEISEAASAALAELGQGRSRIPGAMSPAELPPDLSVVDVDAPMPTPLLPPPFRVQVVLAALAAVTAALVIGSALALAAAEGREEREVLAVVGSRPRDLAVAAGARASLMAGLGGVMAVPLGLLPLAVASASLAGGPGPGMPFLPPWPTIVLVAGGLPLLVGLVAAGVSATAQVIRPPGVTTAAFQ